MSTTEKRLPSHITEDDIRTICEVVIPDVMRPLLDQITQLTAERDAAHADLREAQQILSIVAGRSVGIFVTRAEIIAYQDGGSFHVVSEPDGLHVTRTN